MTVPRLKKKWIASPTAVDQAVKIIHVPCNETPPFPNVRQAARQPGFPNPTTSGAQGFRRWAKKIGAKTVRVGNHDTFNLKELEEL